MGGWLRAANLAGSKQSDAEVGSLLTAFQVESC